MGSIQPYSWLGFVTAKGCKVTWTKGKRNARQSPEETRRKLLGVPSQLNHTKNTFNSSGRGFDDASGMLSARRAHGRLCSRCCPWELLMSTTLCPAHSNIPDSQKESRCSAQSTLLTQTVQAREPFLPFRESFISVWGTVYLSHSNGQCHKAGFSKDTSLRLLYGNSFLHGHWRSLQMFLECIRKVLRELERPLPGRAVSHKIRVQISCGAFWWTCDAERETETWETAYFFHRANGKFEGYYTQKRVVRKCWLFKILWFCLPSFLPFRL